LKKHAQLLGLATKMNGVKLFIISIYLPL